jgi:hypothetical protein
MASQAKTFLVVAKTPSLLIPQEQKGAWRRKYATLALRKVRAGLKTVYLFSLPETEKMLLRLSKENLRLVLNNWRKLASLKNFKIGFFNHSHFKSLISDGVWTVFAIKGKAGKSIRVRVARAGGERKLKNSADYDIENAIRVLQKKAGI